MNRLQKVYEREEASPVNSVLYARKSGEYRGFAIKKHEALALIPPRRDAVIRGKSPFEQRDENLRGIRKLGRKRWKKQNTYHRRSLVETAFFRLKAIFSDRLRGRRMETQSAEAPVRCLAMNRMMKLEMPQSYAV
jgi:hypothetical protein